MAFILDHLQPVEPAFRELENHFLGTGNQSFGSCTSIPLLNFFPRIQTLLSFSGHREVIFRELESHFLGTKKSFSGNLKETLLSFLGCWEVIFWEQESHFLGTWKKPCYHFQDTKSFSGNRKVIFWELGSHFPGTGKSFSGYLELKFWKLHLWRLKVLRCEGIEVRGSWGAKVLRCEGVEVENSWPQLLRY